MDIEPRLRELLRVQDPGIRFTDSVMARIDAAPAASMKGVTRLVDVRSRKRSRRTWIVALVAVGVAAAMLSQVLTDTDEAAGGVAATTVDPKVEAIDPAQVDARVAPVIAVDAPQAFTIRVAPLVVDGDAGPDAAIASQFRELVARELGRVPGAVLVDPASRDATYDVVLTFASRASSSDPAVEVEAGSPAVLERMARLAEGTVFDLAEHVAERGKTMLSADPDPAAVAASGIHLQMLLDDPGKAAQRLARILRVRLFPLSAELEQHLLAILGDSSRRSPQRLLALEDILLVASRRGPNSRADAAITLSGARLALEATEVGARERAWTALRKTRNPALVQFIARGLQTDPAEQVRLLLVKVLASEFRDDAAAHDALLAATRDNSLPSVRMAALRELGGHGWNEFVAATLKDSRLSARQRLQPLADLAPPLERGRAAAVVELDEATIRDTTPVLLAAARDLEGSTIARAAMRALVTVGSPAARDVVLGILSAPIDAPPGDSRMAGVGLRNEVVDIARTWYRGDADVHAALERLAKGIDGQSGDLAARSALSSMDMKSRMDAARQGDKLR